MSVPPRLFHRICSPSLPAPKGPYAQGKRQEYEGDLKGAMSSYFQAMVSGDRADSAMKDIAGLLNMLGRCQEAVDFLKQNERYVENFVGYKNLIDRLLVDLERAEDNTRLALPRTLKLEGLGGSVKLALCDRLFPNPAKIKRIVFLNSQGTKALVHFATHSAARKALGVQGGMKGVEWASSEEEDCMRKLESKELCGKAGPCTFDKFPDHLSTYADFSVPVYEGLDDDGVSDISIQNDSPWKKFADLDSVQIGDTEEFQLKENASPIARYPESLNNNKPEISVNSPETQRPSMSPPSYQEMPYLTHIRTTQGNYIPAVIFPLPGVDSNAMPQDPKLLTQFVLASAHAVLAAQTADQLNDRCGNSSFLNKQCLENQCNPSLNVKSQGSFPGADAYRTPPRNSRGISVFQDQKAFYPWLKYIATPSPLLGMRPSL